MEIKSIDLDDPNVQSLKDRFFFRYLDYLPMNPEDIHEITDEMIWNYQSLWRRHHTLRHVDEIQIELRLVRDKLIDPDGVAFAADMHDVIQIARAPKRDVELSLTWGQTVIDMFAVQPCFPSYKVCVEATSHDHDSTPSSSDARYFADADLSILGKSTDRYNEYALDIRYEFSWVPKPMYGVARSKVMQGFLNRERLYRTDHFADLYEAQARKNISREIAYLTKDL